MRIKLYNTNTLKWKRYGANGGNHHKISWKYAQFYVQYYGECLSLCIENVFNALHLGFMVHTLHTNSCIILFCIGFWRAFRRSHITSIRGCVDERCINADGRVIYLIMQPLSIWLGNSLCHCYLKRFNENSMHFKWKWEWKNPQTTTKWNICHIIPWRFLRSLHSDYIFLLYAIMLILYAPQYKPQSH